MQSLKHPDLLFHEKLDEIGIDKKWIWMAFMSSQRFTDKQSKDTFMLCREKLICILHSSIGIVQYMTCTETGKKIKLLIET